VPGFFYKDANAPTPNKPRRVGVAALIERNKSLLLDLRVDPPGWGLIAGSVEDDESLPDALVREVAEETGLHVSGYELFGVFSHPERIVSYADGNTFQIITVVFTVGVDHFGPLRPSAESAELRFVPRGDLHAFDLVATHRPIVDRYLTGRAGPHVE
jgi:8-oxo-dGTP pyrophosphatase MutT (NUDIX family)